MTNETKFEQLTLFDSTEYYHEEDEFQENMQMVAADEIIRAAIEAVDDKSSIEYLIIAGTVGRWNGRSSGYRLEGWNEDFDVWISGYEHTVIAEADGTIRIDYRHHDGVHRMNIFAVTIDNYIEESEIRVDTIDDIMNELQPVKLTDEQIAFLKGGR